MANLPLSQSVCVQQFVKCNGDLKLDYSTLLVCCFPAKLGQEQQGCWAQQNKTILSSFQTYFHSFIIKYLIIIYLLLTIKKSQWKK